jgi:hypothetical protein
MKERIDVALDMSANFPMDRRLAQRELDLIEKELPIANPSRREAKHPVVVFDLSDIVDAVCTKSRIVQLFPILP